MARKAYFYSRFATAAQEERGKAQHQKAEQWCRENGVELTQAPGIGLVGFMDEIHAGGAAPGSFLVVENLDRLSRTDTIHFWANLLSMLQNGIKIVVLSGKHHSTTTRVFDENSTIGELLAEFADLSSPKAKEE